MGFHQRVSESLIVSSNVIVVVWPWRVWSMKLNSGMSLVVNINQSFLSLL